MDRCLKYNCKTETTCNPSNFGLLNKHWYYEEHLIRYDSLKCHCFKKIFWSKKGYQSQQGDPPQKFLFNNDQFRVGGT